MPCSAFQRVPAPASAEAIRSAHDCHRNARPAMPGLICLRHMQCEEKWRHAVEFFPALGRIYAYYAITRGLRLYRYFAGALLLPRRELIASRPILMPFCP